jgi:hypothetical protein
VSRSRFSGVTGTGYVCDDQAGCGHVVAPAASGDAFVDACGAVVGRTRFGVMPDIFRGRPRDLSRTRLDHRRPSGWC